MCREKKGIIMPSFNKIILMGNLTADPELRQTPSGVSVCKFSLAVARKWGEGDNRVTDFFDVVTWRKTAEFVARYFKKGQAMLVCGELQNESFTDKQGNKRTVSKIVADEVSFTGNKTEEKPKSDAVYTPTPYAQNAADGFEEVSADADLPF